MLRLAKQLEKTEGPEKQEIAEIIFLGSVRQQNFRMALAMFDKVTILLLVLGHSLTVGAVPYRANG